MIPVIALTMTDAGLAAFTASQLEGAADLVVSHVGLTDTAFVVAPTLTALPGQFKTIATISGAAVGDNIVHLMIRDDSADAYAARGLGLFLADGTLFAVYGQADEFVSKSPLVTFQTAIDIVFPTPAIDALTFGDTNFLNPPATETTAGVAAIATIADVEAGVDDTRLVTSFKLAHRLAEILSSVLTAIAHTVADYIPLAQRGAAAGVATLDANATVPAIQLSRASAAEVIAGGDPNKVVTPAALAGAAALFVTGAGRTANGYWRSTSDGTLEQEGEITTSFAGDEPAVQVTLPTPFPDANYRISLTPALNAAASDKDDWVQIIRSSKTPAGFQVQIQRPGTSTTSFGLDGFEWRAWRRAI